MCLIGLFVAFLFLTPSCDENSSAVEYARSLSDERLARLYSSMEKYSKLEDTPLFGYNLQQDSVPEEFSDLNVARIRPKDGNIMVEGCFDHYVYLNFEGYSMFTSDQRNISVSWGEGTNAGSEILWHE